MHVIAMGGHLFDRPEARALDRYLLGTARESRAVERPRVCFLSQASGEARDYTIGFYAAYSKLACIPAHLSLFQPHTGDVEGFLMEQDAIFVGGGNTKSLIALWREWELDHILRAAGENGTVLGGVSAGANCWFEWCTTDSIPGRLRPLPCLGYVPGSVSPHYDGEPERRPTFHRLIGDGTIPPGYAFDDMAAGHFLSGTFHRAVTARSGAQAYRVDRADDGASETPITTTLLPSPDD